MLNLKNLIFFRKNVNVGANIFFNVPKNAVLSIYRRTRPEPPQPVPASSCGPEQPAGTTSQPLAATPLRGPLAATPIKDRQSAGPHTGLLIPRDLLSAEVSGAGRNRKLSSETASSASTLTSKRDKQVERQYKTYSQE